MQPPDPVLQHESPIISVESYKHLFGRQVCDEAPRVVVSEHPSQHKELIVNPDDFWVFELELSLLRVGGVRVK